MWPRDMLFMATGILDKRNKAILSVMKSVKNEESLFGFEIPKCPEGYVRIEIKRGFHYFQRLENNKTKYMSIFNTDMDLKVIPTSLINFFT